MTTLYQFRYIAFVLLLAVGSATLTAVLLGRSPRRQHRLPNLRSEDFDLDPGNGR
jgi:hypothetical protein